MSGKKWSEAVSAVGIGLGLGAVLGVLLAPKSGEELRDSLLSNTKEGLDAARAQGVKLAKGAQRTVEAATERLKDAVEAGGRAYREAMKTLSLS